MYPDVRYAIQYYQASANCDGVTLPCPDVVPGYEWVYSGLIVISIGVVILVFAQRKERLSVKFNDRND